MEYKFNTVNPLMKLLEQFTDIFEVWLTEDQTMLVCVLEKDLSTHDEDFLYEAMLTLVPDNTIISFQYYNNLAYKVLVKQDTSKLVYRRL